MVKTSCFQCKGCRINPWLGNLDLVCRVANPNKEKENDTCTSLLLPTYQTDKFLIDNCVEYLWWYKQELLRVFAPERRTGEGPRRKRKISLSREILLNFWILFHVYITTPKTISQSHTASEGPAQIWLALWASPILPVWTQHPLLCISWHNSSSDGCWLINRRTLKQGPMFGSLPRPTEWEPRWRVSQ